MNQITDDFSEETATAAIEDSDAWELGTGSSAGAATFEADGDGVMGVEFATGTVYALRTDDPDAVNQRAECRFEFANPTINGYVGAICRWVDSDNYVLAQVSHSGTPSLTLVERIAGSNSTLATVSAVGAGAPGGAVRLEVIGNRARVWYESAQRDVSDRPPDAAADLASSGSSTASYAWGLYLSCGAANTMRVEKFQAADLPDKVFPPPDFTVADASDSAYAFSPITVEVAGISTLAPPAWLEWEIYPADDADMPEAYRDVTDASLATRVFFVRSGYAYDVRVRAVNQDGTAGAWTALTRVTAGGSQVLPAAPALPTEVFPDITPDYVLERVQETETDSSAAESGRERHTAGPSFVRPRNRFGLTFARRSDEEAMELLNFFKKMQGANLPFQWTHPISGTVYAMRFAGDDYSEESEDIFWSLGFEIEEVIVGTATTITLSLAVDDTLLGIGSGS
jgi:phage-related protein